jgi:hypothetical protein
LYQKTFSKIKYCIQYQKKTLKKGNGKDLSRAEVVVLSETSVEHHLELAGPKAGDTECLPAEQGHPEVVVLDEGGPGHRIEVGLHRQLGEGLATAANHLREGGKTNKNEHERKKELKIYLYFILFNIFAFN